MQPLVSLAMPVFNGENYIKSAIECLLAQDYVNIELIITDNASDDTTRQICLGFANRDSRLRYVANPRNLGAAPNFNRGFELARGEFLKWCAHDDMISPNYVSACVAALQEDPGASLAFGRTQCIDGQGAPTEHGDTGEMGAILHADPARRFHDAIALAATCFPIFGVFRMEALRRTTLHRSYYGSDRALIAEAALLGRCLLVNSAVFYNREHPQRSIRMIDHGQRSRWQDTSASRSASMEHVSLLMHLVEIARRHRRLVRPGSALLQVAKLRLTPRELGRVALDLTRYVSPALGASLRRLFVGPPEQARPSVGG